MSAISAREHHWDSLRAFLMLLGIPYHSAMVYNARVLWDIQSPEKSEILTFLSGLFVTFRMPAFFIVAGYFAAMMLERRAPAAWLRSRLTRLGIPFLTGLVLLAPVQIALIDIHAATTGAAALTEALNRAARDVTHPDFSWIMHLWFLPALIAYSILLVLFQTLVPSTLKSGWGDRARSLCNARPGLALGLLVATVALWEVFVNQSQQLMLSIDGALAYLLAHGIDPYLRYLPFFFVGAALRSLSEVRMALVWRSVWTLPAVAITTAVVASLLRGRDASGLDMAHNAVDGAAAVLVSLVLIGMAERFFNRPDPRVDRIVDASFSIYLLHHPIIYALATLFLLVSWPPLAEFAVICLVTFLLSYAAHRLIRRSAFSLFLFNGVPISRRAGKDGATGDVTTLR